MKSHPSHLISLLIAWLPLLQAGAAVRINEVLSSNTTSIIDEDGDHSDWIELTNTGESAVSLADWGLSDAPATPFKWRLPDISLDPGSHLLIWASSKNRSNPAAPLHAGFSISSGGEPLVLTDSAGVTVDQTDLPPLPENTSYGRKPDAGEAWFYFETPTPGAANTTPGYAELMSEPQFSVAGGFHAEAFDLGLEVPGAWTIYYTLDGSEPDPSRVGSSAKPYRKTLVYAGPIPMRSRKGEPNVFSAIRTTAIVPSWLPSWQPPAGEVFKANIVRARAYDPASGRFSRTATRTFFVDPAIHGRYGKLPVISLVSDYVNLFDNSTGIYVPGSTHGGVMLKQNFCREWVRSASVEWFDSDGSTGFDGTYEINIQGTTSAASPQKSLNVIARSELGTTSIPYPLFAGTGYSAAPFPSYKRFVLRSWGSALNWPVFFSDAYNQSLAADTDHSIQAYRPVIAFINGEYWGVHEVRESNKNSHYHQAHTGINRDDPGFDMLEGMGAIVDEGDAVHWNETIAYINANKPADPVVWNEITRRIDVQNFAEYIVHCVFTGKRDWPGQNEAKWRPRTPDGRWRWTQYDMDHGLSDFGKPEYDMLKQVLVGAPDGHGPHTLLVKLLANPGFKADFINTYADWLNSRFLTSVELARFDAMKAELSPFIAEYDLRWPKTHNWSTTSYGRNIIIRRGAIRRNQLRTNFGLGSDVPVTLDANPEHGSIRCNSLLVDERLPGVKPGVYPWSGTYFKNLPITLEAVPREGHRFLGWQVKINRAVVPSLDGGPLYYSRQSSIRLTPSGATWAMALFEPIIINDLHVWDFENPDDPYSPTTTAGGGVLTATPGGNVLVSTPSQGFTTSHLRVNNPIGSILDWSMPTLGHQGIRLSYQTRRSGSGAGTQALSYTVDGLTWTTVETYAVQDADPQTRSYDFSGVPAAINNPAFGIRITFTADGGGTSGNNRFDHVILSGEPLGATVDCVVDSSPEAGARITASPADIRGVDGGTTPLHLTYRQGQSVTFTAPASHQGRVFARWLCDGSDYGSTTAIYVTMDDGHQYTAVYETAPPLITRHPANVSARPGDAVVFSVTAEGALTYQWRFNGTEIPEATLDALQIPSVATENAGSYDVVVTGPGGSTASRPAMLWVGAPTALINGSFEAGYSGWTASGNQELRSNAAPYVATDGTTLISFNNGNTAPNGSLSQTLATTPGQDYLLTFDLGVLAYNTSQQRMLVTITGNGTIISSYQSISKTGTAVLQWSRRQIAFTANSATTVIVFRDTSATTANINLLLDNVRIAAVTPVPGDLLVNGGFEKGFEGWQATGNRTISQSSASSPSSEGTRHVSFNSGNTTPNGTVSQSFATTPGSSYSLEFDIGVTAYNRNTQVLGVAITGQTGLLGITTSVTGLGNGTTRWYARQFTFTADSASAMLVFTDRSTTTNGIDLLLDHVRISPAPAAMRAMAASSAALTAGNEASPTVTQSASTTLPPDQPWLGGQPGESIIRVNGSRPGWYVLERSPDLRGWEAIEKRYLEVPGLLEFSDTSADPAWSGVFYRIALPDPVAAP